MAAILQYFFFIFDSIGSNLSLDSTPKIKEEEMSQWAIKNTVACEESERVKKSMRVLRSKKGIQMSRIGEREILRAK